MFAAAWWYVIVHNAAEPEPEAPTVAAQSADQGAARIAPRASTETTELGTGSDEPADMEAGSDQGVQELGTGFATVETDSDVGKVPENFYEWFWGFAALSALVLLIYYWRMDGEQLEILKMLEASVVPLGVLTFVVLAVILFGITTATESAGVGALGAMYLANYAKYLRTTLWSSLAGVAIGLALGSLRGDIVTLIVSGSLGGIFLGTAGPWIWDFLTSRKLLQILQGLTFLTPTTTAMRCCRFVGSAL